MNSAYILNLNRGRFQNVFYAVEICSSRSYRAATYTHYTVEVYCASADCSVQLDFFTNATAHCVYIQGDLKSMYLYHI